LLECVIKQIMLRLAGLPPERPGIQKRDYDGQARKDQAN